GRAHRAHHRISRSREHAQERTDHRVERHAGAEEARADDFGEEQIIWSSLVGPLLLSSPRRRGPITTKVSVVAGAATSTCCGVWSPPARRRQQQILTKLALSLVHQLRQQVGQDRRLTL